MHIEIPEPCHEDWQDMTPQEKGRFCDKCCKVVVDFTNMATDKVIEFIQERKNDRVCGRFRPDQIVVPVAQKINRQYANRMKIFLAALVLVFGGMLFTGCGSHPEKMGKVANNNFTQENFNVDTPNLKNNNVVPRDTTTKAPIKLEMKGKVKCVTHDTTVNQIMPSGGAMLVPDEKEPKLMGKPSVNPKDTL
jgi:hypothetical protein